MHNNYVPVASVFSKDKKMYGGGFPFSSVIQGDGAYIQGDDKKWYIDWVSGLGANLFGYANYPLTEYIKYWLSFGSGFSLPSTLEYQAAEKLCLMLAEHVPGWTRAQLQVRWVTSGSEACNAAIRLARAITNRKMIATAGYHGQADQFVVTTAPHHGIPDEVGTWMQPFEWGNIQSLAKWECCPDIAAIILEQGIVDPDPHYYRQLREFCDHTGCLLIVDEVVTGLRYGLGGACEKYHIVPDLICMGKGLSAGNAIAALVGPKQYMAWFARTDPVFISSTNAGNVAGLAAVDWIIEHFDINAVQYLERIGTNLLRELNRIGMATIGHPTRSVLNFKDDYEKGYFISRMARGGVIMNRPNFPTLSHVNSLVDRTVGVASMVVSEMQKMGEDQVRAVVAAEGVPMTLFRNR